MAVETDEIQQDNQSEDGQEEVLKGGSYEIIRKRLLDQSNDLFDRIEKLNHKRKEVFGALENKIVATDRIVTENNCIPRDMIALGSKLLFGYKVFIGLKTETKVEDVFSVYEMQENSFKLIKADFMIDPTFLKDFKDLYQYYKDARFACFSRYENVLLMVFQIGKTHDDIKAFKWHINPDRSLEYVNDRADRDYYFPSQHDFEWTKTTRDQHRYGRHPHVSIEDKIFVECVGGDLTIKVEDNTEDGSGLYAEEVDQKDQTLDDAQISYTIFGSIIVLKILPYQEEKHRYFLFNEKRNKVLRLDDIEQCAIHLPDNDGLIFPRGYYLQTGEHKSFNLDASDMKYFKTFRSPNGEDFLYIFYNEDSGEYILLQYNLISKKVETPVTCHGYTIYNNGKMVLFKTDHDAKKSHAIQVWQTPFIKDLHQVSTDDSSYLSKIGNKELVQGIADLKEIYNMVQTKETYLGIYHELVRSVTNALDLHFWLDHEDAFTPKAIVIEIRDTANSAIDEYEKVIQIKENTGNNLVQAETETKELLQSIKITKFKNVNDFVEVLTKLQIKRGSVISLKELRYIDLSKVETLENSIGEQYDTVSQNCVDFLLKEEALNPFFEKLQQFEDKIPTQRKVAEIKELGTEIEELNKGVDLLTDLVNNLKIEDSTQTSQIIDRISNVYSRINQVKAIHKKHLQSLFAKEAQVEFNAQFKLVSQSVTNFLDQSDTPDKCEELLTKIMVQIEELEGKFADFDDYIDKLSEKRNEVYSTFNNKKVQLQESRNRKTQSLWNSADRILKGIANRISSLKTIDELNGYFASDIMVSKAQDISKQLFDLGDSVKSEDIVSRIKSIHQDGARQLKDRVDLFADGDNIITLGAHKFTINKESVDLTTVTRDADMYFHLTGTEFFDKIDDEEFDKSKKFWQQEWISETKDIYRAEYLCYQFLTKIETENKPISRIELKDSMNNPKKLLEPLRDFMNDLYQEGYEKGIHDEDCLKIAANIYPIWLKAESLKYHSITRAYGAIFWYRLPENDNKIFLRHKINSFGYLNNLTKHHDYHPQYVQQIKAMVEAFYSKLAWPVQEIYLGQTADFLFEELKKGSEHFPINKYAYDIYDGFDHFLQQKDARDQFGKSLKAVDADLASKLFIIQDWISNFVTLSDGRYDPNFISEAISLFIRDSIDEKMVKPVNTKCEIEGLVGQHSRLDGHHLKLDIGEFMTRLENFSKQSVPQYRAYVKLKRELTEDKKERMRLGEFKPKIMSAFVRNKLIDKVYLPLIGTNLAKQMGAYGTEKRTDLMGLLLLISPPGYGKTTLMEYVANRLGLIFMKINGPAIGHQVTSLDPDEANNATAREEVEKLNLAFEMGNNVMIYLDDIQHCNPEFLQKFISLCDAQRKIEGVYRGKTRTYDLRGKKVSIVMAGNPYTESGEKFRVPDMLANRADTYNLGDILGGSEEEFKLSYLENCLTSNSILSKLVARSQHDVYEMVSIAKTGSSEGVTFESNYSMEEVKEFVSIFQKLLIVQEVVLKVNQQYIYSAGQDEAYRTEPNFLLQGSYRNMNKMVEKILPIMNKKELTRVILDHYTDESQLLTSGAEFNLLRFKEMVKWINTEESERLQYIRTTYKQNKALGDIKEGDPMSQITGQITVFNNRFDSLVDVIEKELKK